MVIVDATWLQTYSEQQDEFCMCGEYKLEDGSKRHQWHKMAPEAKLKLQRYVAVHQRIDLNCVLPHLDRSETEQYIQSHLKHANGR